MMNFNFMMESKEFESEKSNINVRIDLDKPFDGGVYMFSLNKVPLYIGQTNIFSMRLIGHLYELSKDKSYFGLGELSGDDYTLTCEILVGSLPYSEQKEENEKNLRKRLDEEKKYIEEFHPLIQNPKLSADFIAENGEIIFGKYDAILKTKDDDKNLINKIVKNSLTRKE